MDESRKRDPSQPTTASLVRPKIEFTYDVDLVARAVLYYKINGELMTPEEADSINDEWLSDVQQMLAWWDFEEHAPPIGP